jgi:hypothetical protein
MSKAIEVEEDIVLCTEYFPVYVDCSEVTLCEFREQFSLPPANYGLHQSLIPAQDTSQSSTRLVTDDSVILNKCHSYIDFVQTESDSDADIDLL